MGDLAQPPELWGLPRLRRRPFYRTPGPKPLWGPCGSLMKASPSSTQKNYFFLEYLTSWLSRSINTLSPSLDPKLRTLVRISTNEESHRSQLNGSYNEKQGHVLRKPQGDTEG